MSKLIKMPTTNMTGLHQVLFGWDADKTYTNATVRNELNKHFLQAYHDMHDITGGHLFTFTNSGQQGLDIMLGGRKLPALVSQGTLLRIEEGAEFIRHPDLIFDPKEMIDGIDRLAQELIGNHPGYFFTRSAAVLHANPMALKGEHKDTVWCVVFDEGSPEAQKYAENLVDDVIEQLGLRGIFHKHCGRDAIELVPYDKDGVPFDKWRGVQWVMDLIGSGKKLILAEDSNNDMLINAARAYNSFNIAVGDQLPRADGCNHIHYNLDGIEGFQLQMQYVAVMMQREGVINLNWFKNPNQAQAQPVRRVPRVS